MKERRDIVYPLRILLGTLILIIVSITIAQVLARFVFNSPLIWSDELARFLLVWMVFIGAAVVSFDDKHMAVDLFSEKLSDRTNLMISIALRFLILIFLIFTIHSSIELVMVSHSTSSGSLKIPFSYWRVSATVGSILMFIFIIIRTIFDIQDYKNHKLTK